MAVAKLLMPQLGANDDVVRLLSWNIDTGQDVTAGQVIAELETTKAVFSLEAEASGYLYPIVEAGQEVPVRSVLAIVLDKRDDAMASTFLKELQQEKDVTQQQSSAAGPANVQLTAKARQLVEKLGVDISGLSADRVIREQDILALVNGNKNSPSIRQDKSRVVAVYGASQGGITLVDAIRSMGAYEVRTFLDDTPHLIGSSVFGIAVRSGADLESLPALGIGTLATHIAVREFRLKLRDRAAAAGLSMLNVIHPRAYVSQFVQMGIGILIKAGAIVDTETQLGDCCIIDNGVIVAHHNVIHQGCHLAPGVAMGGGCSIGELTLIGIGSKISSRIQIGRNVIARPGSVIVNDIPDDSIVAGNPAKVIGRRQG